MIAQQSPSLWVSLLGAQVHYVDAAGVRTRVIEAGQGPPLILLHGLGGHAETWARNVVPLAERFHVYAVDMLGHGLTARPDVRYSLPALAAHVLSVMDAVGAPRASLMGQSLGGWVATWLALEHPARVERLVLVAGAGLQAVDGGLQAATQVANQVRDVTRAALDAPSRETVRKRLEWLMFRPDTVTDELVDVRYHMFTVPGDVPFAQVVDDTSTTNDEYYLTPERLQEIDTPTLVLWTRHNPTTPWETGQRAAALLPQGRFVLIEDAAHWPQFEQPAEFHGLVVPFPQGEAVGQRPA